MSLTGNIALDVLNKIYKDDPDRLEMARIAAMTNEEAWEELQLINKEINKRNNESESKTRNG